MFNKFKKGKKVDLKPQEPRSYADIEKDAQQVTFNAGQVQYQIHIYTQELERLNEQLKKLNHEGAASKAWETAQAAKETPVSESEKTA